MVGQYLSVVEYLGFLDPKVPRFKHESVASLDDSYLLSESFTLLKTFVMHKPKIP
jgi:hypothetical protein